MKKLFFLTCLVIHITTHAQVKIGDNPTSINGGSLLELESNQTSPNGKGFVPPRVSLTALNSTSPLPSSPALITGTLVFNTNAAVGTGIGLYWWNATTLLWVPAGTGAVSTAWSLTGNTAINPSTNFLGTTDLQPFVLRTNNIERLRVLSGGNVGIGTTTPGSALDVKGAIRLSGSTSGFVGLQPAAAAGSTTYTLPATDGTNGQVLTTNGTGTLSWATASGGGGGSGWLLTGNNGTTPGTNFVGTLDQQSLMFKVGGTQAGFLGVTSSSLTSFGISSSTGGQFSTAIGASAVASANSTTALGYTATASQQFAIAIGVGSQGSGQSGIAIGQSSIGSAQNGIAIGNAASATVNIDNIAIGSGAQASVQNGIAIGPGAKATNQLTAMALGKNANARGQSSTAIGDGAVASAQNSLALGVSATASANNSIAMGNSSLANAVNATAYGAGTQATGGGANAFGNGTIASGINSVAIGSPANATAASSIALGDNSFATAPGAIAFGNGSEARATGSIAIGTSSTIAATGANSLIFGANSTVTANDVTIIGNGITGAGQPNTLILGNAAKRIGIGTLTPTHKVSIVGTNIGDDPLFISKLQAATPAAGDSVLIIKAGSAGIVKAAPFTAFSGGGGGGTVTSFSFANGNGFTGTVTNSTTTPTLSLTLQNATTSQAGQLIAADWNTFNNKVGSITLTTPGSIYTTPVNFTVTNGAATGALSLVNQTANTVLAGPATGVPAAPTFRALVAADIPSLAGNYIQNQTTQQAASNFNISGSGTIGANLSVTGTLTSAGGAASINNNSNFATNINTGTSTGTVTIGGASNNINLPKLNTTAVVLTDASRNLTSTATATANTYLFYNGTNFTWQPSGTTAWSLTGNAGTTAGTNYIGTSDGVDFVVKTANAERMRIVGGATNTGWIRLGAGSAAPRSPVDMVGNFGDKNILTIQNSANNGYSSVDMFNSTGTLTGTFGYANPGVTDGTVANKNYFAIYDKDFLIRTTGNGSGVFYIQNGGNIGINTNNPQAKLDVNGSFRFNGAISINGDAGQNGWALTSSGGGTPYWKQNISLADFAAVYPLTYDTSTGVFGITKATALTDGYISLTDWNLFNSKISSLSLNTPGLIFTSPINFSISNGVATGDLTLVNQDANTVFAGPAGGAPGIPGFRALEAADIPSGSGNYIQNQTTQQAAADFNISGSGTIGTDLSVNGTYKLGASGTVTKTSASFVIPVNITIGTGIGQAQSVVFTMPSALSSTKASVASSPAFDLPNGVLVQYARVSSTTEITLRILNVSGSSQTLTGDFYVTVTEF